MRLLIEPSRSIQRSSKHRFFDDRCMVNWTNAKLSSGGVRQVRGLRPGLSYFTREVDWNLPGIVSHLFSV